MEVGYWCRIPAADENENVRPPLTLTLSHQGAREKKKKTSPTERRGKKKFEIIRVFLLPLMGEGEDEGGI